MAGRPGDDDAYAQARASIARAERELADMFGGAATPPDDASQHAPPPLPRERASASPGDDERASSGASAPCERESIAPAGGGQRRRRAVGGVAVMLAFVPVGLVGSAALAGDGETPAPLRAVESLVRPGAQPLARFDPEAVRAEGGRFDSVVARVPANRVRVHRRPGGRKVTRRLRGPVVEGKRLPLVLLVKDRRRGWLQVYLPTRPNLSTGWIRRSSAKLRRNPYRVRIELRTHRITVWRGDDVIQRARIGVGRALTPTPTGQYYVTDLLRPPEPDGTYGAFAFGLSGHSPVLTSFAGGDGQLGLHGTNRPAALGTDVSHGCIRVHNRVIRRLARTLPLGTPVAIRRGGRARG